MSEHLVIAGGGQAAAQAAQSARQGGFEGRITLVAEEACLPYQRPPLSKKFLAGDIERDRLVLKPQDFYAAREIELMLEMRVESIDPGDRQVRLADGSSLDYSHLLLATGATPRRLDLPGSELAGVHYLRTVADVESIREAFAPGQRLVIVGAGYIGLEVAAVAVGAGLDVTVVEAADRVMARSVCPEMSAFYADYHRQAGVELRLETALGSLLGKDRVVAVQTGAGERLDCDLVIIGIGIVPSTDLAAEAGLECADGIDVDAGCRTAAPGIFAAGDCASYPHPWIGRQIRLESVQNAIEQGKAAAASICGQTQAFDAIPWFWSDQYDLKLQIAGFSHGYDETVRRGDRDSAGFSVFYLRSGRVIAVDCVNDPRVFMTARKYLGDQPSWPVDAIADPATDLAALAEAG